MTASPDTCHCPRRIRRGLFGDLEGGSAVTDDGMVLLSAGTLARRLGVGTTTLRTWHQRYGLGPHGHCPTLADVVTTVVGLAGREPR